MTATSNNIRTATSEWFECTVKYQKPDGNGSSLKNVTEKYVVEASSFTEAESRITEEMAPYTRSLRITDIRPAVFSEVFFSDCLNVDRWYKVRVAFVITDEKTEKDKRIYAYYLVNASCLNDAVKNLDQAFADSQVDYLSVNVTETTILDVFEHEPQE